MSILYPDLYLKSIHDIPLEALKREGKKALILDLDNTIAEWNSQDISHEIKAWFHQVQALGFSACILSNNHEKRIQGVAQQLSIPYVYEGKKPRRKGFQEAIQRMGVTLEQTVMIGDQIFTDIWGGNRMGLYTILVEPMQGREYWGTRITRRFEWLVLKKLNRQKSNLPGIAQDSSCTPGRSFDPNEKGMTFIEVVIGMLIMSLLFSLAGMRINFASARVSLEQEAEKIAWSLRAARQSAITTNHGKSVRFYVYNRQYKVRVDDETIDYFLPEGIDYVGTGNFLKVGNTPTCSFDASGMPNQGGYIVLKNRKGEMRYVIVSTIAGRVRIDTVPPSDAYT